MQPSPAQIPVGTEPPIVTPGVNDHASSNLVSVSLTGNLTVATEVDIRLDGTNSALLQNLGTFQTDGLLTFQLQTAPTPRNPAKGP
jgi:hypothetical protein